MVNKRTLDLLADKLDTAAVLIRHAEQDSASDFADWTQVLRDLYMLASTVSSATDTAVSAARAAGLSWGDVAQPLAITRQGAQQRWG